jgi:hypothetical protein
MVSSKAQPSELDKEYYQYLQRKISKDNAAGNEVSSLSIFPQKGKALLTLSVYGVNKKDCYFMWPICCRFNQASFLACTICLQSCLEIQCHCKFGLTTYLLISLQFKNTFLPSTAEPFTYQNHATL